MNKWANFYWCAKYIISCQIILENPNQLPKCVKILENISHRLGEMFAEAGRGANILFYFSTHPPTL
jgi:hypothetical protein